MRRVRYDRMTKEEIDDKCERRAIMAIARAQMLHGWAEGD